MKQEHVQTILDALEWVEAEFKDRYQRQPKTRSGKPNPLRAHFLEQVNKIQAARLGFERAMPRAMRKITGA